MSPLFTILGRGKAGRALAEALALRGAPVPLQSRDARPEGLVLLAVPDTAVEAQAACHPGRCVHLSGSLHVEGIPCLHPLTSFDGRAADWAGTPLGVTGEAPAVILQAFVALGFVPFELPAALKPLYHACAVLTSGHAATLWLGAERLLREAGVDLPGRGLMPLAEATVRNIETHGPAGRTGPFVRGDEATILRDLEALPVVWRDVFQNLGRL